MQAIIMAAGFGSRIAKISGGRPKSFLEINGEKLINRAVRLLRERNVTDITVVTGYQAQEIEDVLDNDIHFVHNPLYFCTNVLGSFACAIDSLHDDFIFIHADTIFDPTILDDVIKANNSDITLPIDFKSCVEEEMKVLTDSGIVTTISKEIDLDIAEGEFIGVAKLKKSILPRLKTAVLEELKDKNNHQGYFEAALQNLIDQGIVIACLATKSRPWIEIDFPEDYETAMELFSQ